MPLGLTEPLEANRLFVFQVLLRGSSQQSAGTPRITVPIAAYNAAAFIE